MNIPTKKMFVTMKTNKIFKGIEWKSIEIGLIKIPTIFLITNNHHQIITKKKFDMTSIKTYYVYPIIKTLFYRAYEK